jgi:hypothetical protein
MKIIFISVSMMALVAFSSCGSAKKSTKNEVKDSTTTTANTGDTKTAASSTNPFPDFPAENLSAASGDNVFATTDAQNPGNKDAAFGSFSITFVRSTLGTPGNPTSKVTAYGTESDVVNYFIIPIPNGGTAKKGDIVVAPWHHGESMMRAVVIDDKDAGSPVVNFIDVDWDNPAKGDKGVGYGQEQTTLAPNTFYVLNAQWQSGSSLAVKVGSDWKKMILIKTSGDQVLAIDEMGKVNMYAKAECKCIPGNGDIKAGAEVMAPKYGNYVKSTVQKVDKKFGRVYCKAVDSDKVTILPVSDVSATTW